MAGKIIVVGAGIGGLATAARLSSKGYDVEVFEKLPVCGGRNNIIEDRGFKFDTGPSFVLMPDFFEELFTYCNKDIKDYLDLKVLDPSYKIFYPDSDVLTVFKDSDKTKEELERIEKGAAKGFDGFIRETTRLYNITRPLLYKCFSKKTLFDVRYLPLLFKLNPLKSYWDIAKKFFKSEKLLYAFTFEAMFMGVSPFNAPGFYSIISYADHVQKIFHPMGGMYEIPKSLEKICLENGVKIHYNSPVSKINKINRKLSISTDTMITEADKVVVNADYSYTQESLLKRKLPDYKYSCSVYLIYLGLKKKLGPLAHHNLFFSSNLIKNLDEIFSLKNVPGDPSFYIHVPTVTDSSLAPEGKEILYLLIPVPNLDNPKEDFYSKEIYLRNIVFNKINKTLDINLEDLIEVEHRFYPKDFIGKYNIKFGATFGLAHNLMQSAFFRPVNFDNKFRNLYFVGASTQPGGGLPVVIAASRIVADLITL